MKVLISPLFNINMANQTNNYKEKIEMIQKQIKENKYQLSINKNIKY